MPSGVPTYTSADIQRAGGLVKWLIKAANEPAPAPASSRTQKANTMDQNKTPKAYAKKPEPVLGYQRERMNKLEAEYAVYLERLRMAGEICLWKFGSFKLRMADKTWYAPDFFVINKAGISEFHETKGFMRDDAAVKLKTCSELYREFNFYLVKKMKGAWSIVRVK